MSRCQPKPYELFFRVQLASGITQLTNDILIPIDFDELYPRTPIASASSRIDIVGTRPLLVSRSQFLSSVPTMCVTSITSTPAVMQRNENTIAAFFTLSPLGLSVMAHVTPEGHAPPPEPEGDLS